MADYLPGPDPPLRRNDAPRLPLIEKLHRAQRDLTAAQQEVKRAEESATYHRAQANEWWERTGELLARAETAEAENEQLRAVLRRNHRPEDPNALQADFEQRMDHAIEAWGQQNELVRELRAEREEVPEMLKREYGLIAPSGRDPDGQPYSLADTVKAIIDGERAERDRLLRIARGIARDALASTPSTPEPQPND